MTDRGPFPYLRAMLIATAQSPVDFDVSANGAAVRALMRQAREAGAGLVHFPEGAVSGYPTLPEQDCLALRAELEAIAALAGALGLWTVIGATCPRPNGARPHNSLYVISDTGTIAGRYDKRMCSNNEIENHYTPGFSPLVFEAGGLRFGCALCIEINFPQLFAEYEGLDADCVLFSSHSDNPIFGVLAQAHAAVNSVWLSVAVPAQFGAAMPAGVVGPDGWWMSRAPAIAEPALVVARIDRSDPAFDVAINKTRPWRRKAREGGIYRERRVARSSPRSRAV